MYGSMAEQLIVAGCLDRTASIAEKSLILVFELVESPMTKEPMMAIEEEQSQLEFALTFDTFEYFQNSTTECLMPYSF